MLIFKAKQASARLRRTEVLTSGSVDVHEVLFGFMETMNRGFMHGRRFWRKKLQSRDNPTLSSNIDERRMNLHD